MSESTQSQSQDAVRSLPASYPIELLYEANNLYYYASYCCDDADPHWGIIVTGKPIETIVACPTVPVPDPIYVTLIIPPPGGQRQVAEAIFESIQVHLGDEQTGSDSFEERSKQMKVSPLGKRRLVASKDSRPDDPVRELGEAVREYLFDVYEISYKNESLPPDAPRPAQYSFLFACDPEREQTDTEELSLIAAATRSGIRVAGCRADGPAANVVVVSLKDLL